MYFEDLQKTFSGLHYTPQPCPGSKFLHVSVSMFGSLNPKIVRIWLRPGNPWSCMECSSSESVGAWSLRLAGESLNGGKVPGEGRFSCKCDNGGALHEFPALSSLSLSALLLKLLVLTPSKNLMIIFDYICYNYTLFIALFDWSQERLLSCKVEGGFLGFLSSIHVPFFLFLFLNLIMSNKHCEILVSCSDKKKLRWEQDESSGQNYLFNK